ncbi:MAG: NfeD family protein [Rhodocyclaceae bacterium]|nr:NfeD family protein [Rhodocyclaceae bacterium]
MALEWWHWAVAGLVLIVMELAVPAFVLVWFGLGALVLALLTALLPGLGETSQVAIWIVVSLGMVFLWFRIFKPGLHKTRIGTSDANVLGEVGLLVHDVAPFQKSSVRFQKPVLGAESWDCISDETIRGGERVRVLGVEGSLLKVGKVP